MNNVLIFFVEYLRKSYDNNFSDGCNQVYVEKKLDRLIQQRKIVLEPCSFREKEYYLLTQRNLRFIYKDTTNTSITTKDFWREIKQYENKYNLYGPKQRRLQDYKKDRARGILLTMDFLIYLMNNYAKNTHDLMKKKNTVSGVLYVSKNKCVSCQKGYIWNYNNSERKLTAISLSDLKKRVVECGLDWIIIDNVAQQKAFLFDDEVERLLLDYKQKYIVLSKNKQDIKDNHKKLKQLLTQEKNNHKNNINNKIKQLKLERKTHNEQYKQEKQSIQKTRQDLKNTFKKKEKILLADMDKISKDQANIINKFFMPDEKLDEQYRILSQQLSENKQNFLIQDERYKNLQNSIKQRYQQSRMMYKSQIDKLNDDINILQEEYLENKKKLNDNLELQLNTVKEDQYNLVQRKQHDIIDLEYNILYN